MVKVTAVDGRLVQIDADSWHVDELNGLHLRDERRKPVATFAPGKWIAVQRLGAADG